MSWSYDSTLLTHPEAGPLMRLRLMLGDNDPNRQHLEDEEINYFISVAKSERTAAAIAAQAISIRYAHEASFSVGDYRESLNERAKHFSELSKTLGKGSTGVPKPMHHAKSFLDTDDYRLHL